MGGFISSYNSPVCSGEITTSRDYLMRIIRASTFTIQMGDSPLSEPVTEEKIVSEYDQRYHRDCLAAAERELNRLQKLSAKEWLDLARPYLGYKDSTWERRPDTKVAQRRLADMWLKVRKWQPAPGQEYIKESALKKLREDLDYGRPSARMAYRKYQNALTYRQKTLANAQYEYDYHLREYREATELNAWRRQQIRDFITSLEGLSE